MFNPHHKSHWGWEPHEKSHLLSVWPCPYKQRWQVQRKGKAFFKRVVSLPQMKKAKAIKSPVMYSGTIARWITTGITTGKRKCSLTQFGAWKLKSSKDRLWTLMDPWCAHLSIRVDFCSGGSMMKMTRFKNHLDHMEEFFFSLIERVPRRQDFLRKYSKKYPPIVIILCCNYRIVTYFFLF